MVNCNGLIVESNAIIGSSNRSFLYGDGVFETIRIRNNKVLFLEDHYFRLMATMRIVRMEIPMHFTMEYFEEQILLTAKANHCDTACRIRLTIYRNEGGFYLPETNAIGFVIQAMPLENRDYIIQSMPYEIDLYKDFHIPKHLLSTLKTTNKMIYVTGSIFAKENDLQNCFILNEEKNVVEALQGNIFMIMGKTLITPPIADGCLNGVMRKNLLEIAKGMEQLEVFEKSISPFDLQKADELFITNVIQGIQPITKYRKKEYQTDLANVLVQKINNKISGN
jgi:branched-chain amino acid aminotransferase